MKNKIKELSAKRDKLEAEAKALLATIKAASDGGESVDEDGAAFDVKMDEIDAVKQDIERIRADRARIDRFQAHSDYMKSSAGVIGELTQPGATPRERRDAIPAQARKHGHLTLFTGTDGERDAYGFGQWILATQFAHTAASRWCEDQGLQIGAVLSSTANTAGGALIPDEFAARIIDYAETRGVFRRFADRAPMASDTQTWPRVTGGMTAYFVAESAAPTTSDPAFDNVMLTAKELATLTLLPRSLVEDAVIDIAEIVARKGALALMTKEDQCGFIGDGTSTYGGIHGAFIKIDDGNHTASIYTALTGNTAFSTIDLVDFEGLVGSLPEFPGIAPAWFVSKPGFYGSMARLMDAAGGNVKGDVAGGIALQFLGYPVVFVQVANNTLSAQTDTVILLFGDLGMAATFGDRRTLSMGTDSGGKYFEVGQIAIKTTERFDINVHSLGDTSDAGPMLGLKTPAS